MHVSTLPDASLLLLESRHRWFVRVALSFPPAAAVSVVAGRLLLTVLGGPANAAVELGLALAAGIVVPARVLAVGRSGVRSGAYWGRFGTDASLQSVARLEDVGGWRLARDGRRSHLRLELRNGRTIEFEFDGNDARHREVERYLSELVATRYA